MPGQSLCHAGEIVTSGAYAKIFLAALDIKDVVKKIYHVHLIVINPLYIEIDTSTCPCISLQS